MKSKLKSNKIFDLAERCHYQHELRTAHSFCFVFTTLSVAGLSLDGQHSLTSVERPSYLRSDFVNVCHARLEVIHLYFDRLYPTCLIFGVRFCPTFSIIPRLIPIIQTRRCHCLRLKDVLMFQASSYSAGKGPFSGCY